VASAAHSVHRPPTLGVGERAPRNGQTHLPGSHSRHYATLRAARAPPQSWRIEAAHPWCSWRGWRSCRRAGSSVPAARPAATSMSMGMCSASSEMSRSSSQVGARGLQTGSGTCTRRHGGPAAPQTFPASQEACMLEITRSSRRRAACSRACRAGGWRMGHDPGSLISRSPQGHSKRPPGGPPQDQNRDRAFDIPRHGRPLLHVPGAHER